MDRLSDAAIGESERWLSVIVGGMLVLSSLRRRDALAGALFAAAGSALVFRGITGHDRVLEFLGQRVREEWGAGGPLFGDDDDPVDESSMESFPASDAPSWTPVTSTRDDEAV